MAVTSIWRVKGWLGKVVIYIENPGKTTNPEYYQSDAITDCAHQGLEDVISYAVNSNKTQQAMEDTDIMERYVSGVNCNPSTAREEMLAVKKHFGKEDGTIAYELLGALIQKEQLSSENPTAAKTEKSPPSEPISAPQKKTVEGTTKSRPSVREELQKIKAARQEKAEAPKQQEIKNPVKQPIPTVQTHLDPGKKKPKPKVR